MKKSRDVVIVHKEMIGKRGTGDKPLPVSPRRQNLWTQARGKTRRSRLRLPASPGKRNSRFVVPRRWSGRLTEKTQGIALPALMNQRIITNMRTTPVPVRSGESALPITVPGSGSSVRMACPGVGELVSRSPTRIPP